MDWKIFKLLNFGVVKREEWSDEEIKSMDSFMRVVAAGMAIGAVLVLLAWACGIIPR